MSQSRTEFSEFNQDVERNQGYQYTTNAQRSSQVANQRLTDLTLRMVDLRGLRVIDVGCGDGTYSRELFVSAKPASLLGIDAAEKGIERARKAYADLAPALKFETHDVYALPFEPASFDVAVVRGLLHHLHQAPRALERISRIARTVFIIEPNGYSPALKIIERLSRYHREHDEKSYAPRKLRGWIEALGGVVERDAYAGLVPFFCPDWAVAPLKFAELAVEAFPVVRQLGCAVYAVRFRSNGS